MIPPMNGAGGWRKLKKNSKFSFSNENDRFVGIKLLRFEQNVTPSHGCFKINGRWNVLYVYRPENLHPPPAGTLVCRLLI